MNEFNEAEVSDELMEMFSGGKLPVGWKLQADALVPSLRKQYPEVKTYEQAKEIVKRYITDPADQREIFEYMKKYF